MRAVSLGFTLLASASACSLLTDLSSIGDGAADATADVSVIDAPTNGFVLSATPAHLTMDPGDSFPIAVTITRGSQFSGLVKSASIPSPPA